MNFVDKNFLSILSLLFIFMLSGHYIELHLSFLPLCLCLFVGMSICLSIYLSVHLLAYPSVSLSVHLFVGTSVGLSICVFVCPSICLYICWFIHLCLCLYICWLIHLWLYLFCQSNCPSVSLSVLQFVYQSISTFVLMSANISDCLAVHLYFEDPYIRLCVYDKRRAKANLVRNQNCLSVYYLIFFCVS